MYREAKGRYKKLLEEKKRKENERWEKEIREIKREGQVWEVVRKERRKWKRVNEEIKMEEWDEYFRGLLGGVDRRVVRGTRRGNEEDEEEDVSREEIRTVLKGMREKKGSR